MCRAAVLYIARWRGRSISNTLWSRCCCCCCRVLRRSGKSFNTCSAFYSCHRRYKSIISLYLGTQYRFLVLFFEHFFVLFLRRFLLNNFKIISKQEALLLQRNRATRYVSWNIMAVFWLRYWQEALLIQKNHASTLSVEIVYNAAQMFDGLHVKTSATG